MKPVLTRSSSSSTTMMSRLEGKVAIITGGASGIGASLVRAFHQNGAAEVIIADILDTRGEALAKQYQHHRVSYIHCDVSVEEDVKNLVDTAVAKFGRLDIMFNNAGVLDRVFASVLDTPMSDVHRLLDVNLIGSFLGAKHAARVMVPKRKGCIVFMGSACTEIPGLSTPAYTMTKHAIVGLTKNLAAELGRHGIRVNCLSPFGVVTGIGGLVAESGGATIIQRLAETFLKMTSNLRGQFLTLQCVGDAAVYLASDEASYVSGVNLVLDGGFSSVDPTMITSLGNFAKLLPLCSHLKWPLTFFLTFWFVTMLSSIN